MTEAAGFYTHKEELTKLYSTSAPWRFCFLGGAEGVGGASWGLPRCSEYSGFSNTAV